MNSIRVTKSQALLTFFFDSDFEPDILEKIIGVKPKKNLPKCFAQKNYKNPNGLAFFQIATNVAEERLTENAVKVLLQPLLGKSEEINRILKAHNGFIQLDLLIKKSNNIMPIISLSPNTIKFLGKLDARYFVKFV